MLFYIFFVALTIFYCTLTPPLFLFFPACKVALCGVKAALYLCRIFDGITYRIVGRENLPKGPYIIASAHQSPLETFILFAEFKDVALVLKKEVRYIPLFGLYLSALKMVFIDRSKGVSSLRQIIRVCSLRVKEGRTIVIFPSGSRTITSNKEPEYRRGVVALYQHTSLPVVPISLNTGEYWPRNLVSFNKKAGEATLRILPPIEPGLDRQEFIAKLSKSLAQDSTLADN